MCAPAVLCRAVAGAGAPHRLPQGRGGAQRWTRTCGAGASGRAGSSNSSRHAQDYVDRSA
jgi:hypothetical protein